MSARRAANSMGLASRLQSRAAYGGWKINSWADFSGGLNLRVANAELQDNEVAALSNFSLSDVGRLTKRPGLQALTTTLPGPARAMLIWQPAGGARTLYAVCTSSGVGVLVSVDLLSGTVTQIGSGLTATGQPCMLALAGYLVVFDGGAGGGWFYDGTTFGPLGVTAPTAAVTAAASGSSGSGNLNGTYNYYATFARANGMESNPSPAGNTITCSHQAAALTTIPISTDPTVTTVNLYRNGGTVAGVGIKVGSVTNGTTTYTDNLADASILGNEILAFTNEVPPAGLAIAGVYQDRIWASTGQDSNVYYTSVLQPWAWGDGTYWTAVSPDQTGNITGIYPIAQQLMIFKPQSVWALNGQPPTNYTISQSVVPQGCIAPWSIAMTPAGVTYLAQDGLYWTNGYTGDVVPDDQEPQRRNKLEPLIVTIDTSQPVQAVYFDRTYYLLCTVNGTQECVVFDYRHGAWTLYTWGAISACVDLLAGRVYLGMAGSSTVAIANQGTSDLGQPIAASATTKQFVLQSAGMSKAYHTFWLSGADSSAQPQVTVFVDDLLVQFQQSCVLTDPNELIWDEGNWDEMNWGGGSIVRNSYGIPDTMTGLRIGFTLQESSIYSLAIEQIDLQWRVDKVVY